MTFDPEGNEGPHAQATASHEFQHAVLDGHGKLHDRQWAQHEHRRSTERGRGLGNRRRRTKKLHRRFDIEKRSTEGTVLRSRVALKVASAIDDETICPASEIGVSP
jgi:hypothetical protein